MLKVLIVDDEVIVRVGLKAIIDWNKYGFEIIGEASNGREALSIVAVQKPHIIITDIKMPVMDGLELMRNIHKIDKEIKFLVLSGYDDFNLVKQAMKLGAEDYLVKLNIQQKVLIEIMDSISAKIKYENKLLNNSEERNEYIRKNIVVLRQDFFRKLIEGDYAENPDLTETIEYLDIEINKAGFLCVLIKIFNPIESEMEGDDRYARLFCSSFTGIANDIISEEFNSYTINLDQEKVFIIISIDEDTENDTTKSKVKVKEMLERVLEMMREYFNVSIVIGVSSNISSILDLKKGYIECSQAIKYSFHFGINSIIYFTEIEENFQTTPYQLEFEKLMQELKKSIDLEDIQSINGLFEEVINYFKQQKTPREKAIEICYEITYLVFNNLRNDKALLYSIIGQDGVLFKEIEKINSVYEIINWFMRVKEAVLKYLGDDTGNELSNMVQKVKAYINMNYSREIDIKELASHVSISSGYLCNIFKQVTGETITKYITDIKIYHAKMLLSGGVCKTYEVAYNLGYSTSNYFCRVFKKETGLTPKEFILKKSY
jgi:two-component system, response regulator YesN